MRPPASAAGVQELDQELVVGVKRRLRDGTVCRHPPSKLRSWLRAAVVSGRASLLGAGRRARLPRTRACSRAA